MLIQASLPQTYIFLISLVNLYPLSVMRLLHFSFFCRVADILPLRKNVITRLFQAVLYHKCRSLPRTYPESVFSIKLYYTFTLLSTDKMKHVNAITYLGQYLYRGRSSRNLVGEAP